MPTPPKPVPNPAREYDRKVRKAHTMPTYQRAYRLGEMRRFDGWQESNPTARDDAAEDDAPGPLTDDTVVFLHEDLRVTLTCFSDVDVLFQDAGDAWRRFCTDDLGFAVPDWEAESRAVRDALRAAEEADAAPDAPNG